jgi:hypothetical protein
VQYPLSRDEHAAMARCVAGIRKQLQDVSDLFIARYGRESRIAARAMEAAVSARLLEDELLLDTGSRPIETPIEPMATTM